MKRTAWRAFVIVFIGSVLGELLFMVAGILLGSVTGRLGGMGDFADLGLAILGALIGCALGSGIGAHLTRRRISGKSSWGLALLGGILGVTIVMILAEPFHLNQVPWLMWGLMILLPPILAVLLGERFWQVRNIAK